VTATINLVTQLLCSILSFDIFICRKHSRGKDSLTDVFGIVIYKLKLIFAVDNLLAFIAVVRNHGVRAFHGCLSAKTVVSVVQLTIPLQEGVVSAAIRGSSHA